LTNASGLSPTRAAARSRRPSENSAHDFGLRSFAGYVVLSGLLSLSIWLLILLPRYLHDRGWSSKQVGWIFGAYSLFGLLSTLISIPIAQRLGSLSLARLGAGLGLICGVLYGITVSNPVLILGARAAHSAAVAFVYTGALLQLVSSVKPSIRGRMMGYFSMPGFVMIGIGPWLSEWLVAQWGFGVIPPAIVLIFAVIAGLLTILSSPIRNDGAAIRLTFTHLVRTSVGTLTSVLLLSIVFGTSFAAWTTFLSPAMQYLGRGAVSNFGWGYATGAILGVLVVGQKLESQSRRLIGIATLFLFSLGLVLIPVAAAVWQLAVIGALCGVGHGICYPALSSLATERCHPMHLESGTTLYLASSSLGAFLGSSLWGAVADAAGFSAVFISAGALLSMATIAFMFRQRRAGHRDGNYVV
jgi:MFS family permease